MARTRVDLGAARLAAEMAETSDAIAGIDDLSEILRRLAARAKDLVRAEYAAVATFDEAGQLTRFVWAGLDDELARRIGNPPAGKGVLGRLAHSDRPIRLDDLTLSPDSVGWPAAHPDMCAFLGAPIRALGQTIGSLYMTRSRGADPFTEADEAAAAIMAVQIAAVVAGALTACRSETRSPTTCTMAPSRRSTRSGWKPTCAATPPCRKRLARP